MSEHQEGLGGHRTDRPDLARYAKERSAGTLVFFAGLSGRRPDGSIPGVREDPTGKTIDAAEQARSAFENLSALLRANGLEPTDIVDMTCYLVDMADYEDLIESWNHFFPENPPPRTTVAVHQLPDPDLRIELKAIAYRPASP